MTEILLFKWRRELLKSFPPQRLREWATRAGSNRNDLDADVIEFPSVVVVLGPIDCTPQLYVPYTWPKQKETFNGIVPRPEWPFGRRRTKQAFKGEATILNFPLKPLAVMRNPRLRLTYQPGKKMALLTSARPLR